MVSEPDVPFVEPELDPVELLPVAPVLPDAELPVPLLDPEPPVAPVLEPEVSLLPPEAPVLLAPDPDPPVVLSLGRQPPRTSAVRTNAAAAERVIFLVFIFYS